MGGQGIGFMTPVEYGTQPTVLAQKLLEFVDGYLYLGGRSVATVVPNSMLNTSQEVNLWTVRPVICWQNALKISSYILSLGIFPLLALIAKAYLRSEYHFHVSGIPYSTPYVVNTSNSAPKAPLTFVRSKIETPLKISVLYNQKFLPLEPIAPKPTAIDIQGNISKYTWNVRTQVDGTMLATSQEGQDERINMIWWEAIRKEVPTSLDSTQAACVKREEIEGFLADVLKKVGVHDKELEAFAHYWAEVFKNDYQPTDAPYVLVQLIDSSTLDKYVPEIEVEGKEADLFALSRFYFRFEPIAQPTQGVDAESYLNHLDSSELGDNVVIDLGGELAKSTVGQSWKGQDAFNDLFIKKYIFAGPALSSL